MKSGLHFGDRLMMHQFASVLGLEAGTLKCSLGSLTRGADMLPGTLSQLGLQTCCDTGLPSDV